MTIGDGMFLSAIVLSLAALFVATKDRWNWTRIAKWGLVLPLAGVLMIGVGVYLYGRWEDRPTQQTSFGDIALAASKADVKFARGEPASTNDPDRWSYTAGSGSAGPEAADRKSVV